MDIVHGRVTAYKDPKLPAAPVVSAASDWAAGLRYLSAADAEILVAVVRTLYPHDGLAEVIYRRVVVRFDELADAAPVFARFCRMVDALWPAPFAEMSEGFRVQGLKRLEGTPEFFYVQRMAVRYFYDDVEVWAAFGYEGASVHLGGYVRRGFDDLDWLPPLPNDL